MNVPKPIQKVADSFQRLPGIGPKTAQRLAYYLLYVPQEQLDIFSKSLSNLKKEIKTCSHCFYLSEHEQCEFCEDTGRDRSQLCIVEQPLDVIAIEKSRVYRGLYHVLHGNINPLEGIGPRELHIHDILSRLTNGNKNDTIIDEIIVATNPTMEGEATAMYIQKLISEKFPKISITRLGRGLPTGADLEYADEITLSKAFEGRRGME